MVVGRGEKIYSWLLLKPLLGGTSYWDDRPPKRCKFEGEPLGAYLESGEREHLYRGRKGYDAQRDKTSLPLSDKGLCCTVWSSSTPRPDKGG